MTMKWGLILHRSLDMVPHHKMQFTAIPKIPFLSECGGVYLSVEGDTVGLSKALQTKQLMNYSDLSFCGVGYNLSQVKIIFF